MSGGNIVVKLIYILSLFALNNLLRILTLVKWLLTNASQFIQEIVKLLRFLLALSVEETNFYWKNIKNLGKRLLLELEEIIKKMLKETQTLQEDITNDGYHNSNPDTPPVSNFNVVLVLFAVVRWVLFFFIGFIMTIVLITTCFTGLPLLHQALRKLLLSHKNIS